MSENEINRSESGGTGRYEIRVAGHDKAGELTYHRQSDGTIVANHTGVPVSMRGLGVGKALVARLAEDAIREGIQIEPTCPFVRAHLERDANWAKLIRSP